MMMMSMMMMMMVHLDSAYPKALGTLQWKSESA